MSVKISIVIPVYNIESYIIDCLNSIESQEYNNYEVIIVDDGGQDKSVEYVSDFIYDKKQFRLVSQENGGLSKARNTGIEYAQGDYILFLDGDDMLTSNSLSLVAQKIESSGYPDMLVCNYIEFDSLSGEKRDCQHSTIPDGLEAIDFYDLYVNKWKRWISAWSCVVKASVLKEKQLFFCNGLLHEDELWVPQVILAVNKYVYLDEPTHFYRINRDGSIMTRVTYKHLHDKLFICDELYKLRTRQSEEIINKRIKSDMFSVLLSVRYIESQNEKKHLEKQFSAIMICLKNRQAFDLYVLCRIFGFKTVSNVIAVLREKDEQNN